MWTLKIHYIMAHFFQTHNIDHINSKHLGNKVKCKYCKFQSLSRKYLRRHERILHETIDKKYACELCPKKYSELGKLVRHKMKTHTVIPHI